MNSSSISSAVPTIKCEDTSPSPTGPVGTDGESGAYLSVNVNLSAAMMNLLAAESVATTTLRTPEIVNDVITMTNPLDQYNYDKNASFKNGSGNDSNSSMSNSSSATSPASGTPPSIQKTCSELIKAGLKLTIESKRKMSGSDTDGGIKRMKKEESDDDYDSSHTQAPKSELTPEDEERRRRRRERNKIAATKCRMKKRERTVNLVNESEILENQNIDLKAQLKDLEVQKRQLIDMLSVHSASCVKNNTCNARTSPTTPYNMLRAYEPPSTFPANYDTHSPYIRPESANILASSYTCATSINGDSPDTISLDATYMTPQTIELDYNRPDSVLSLPPNSDSCYITTDGYLPKATTILGHIEPETEYYEADLNYVATTPQCHNYPVNLQDSQSKLGTSLNDGCLV
ncbi:proto-oncogene c-Fos [Pararge aegeria]|uniref:proto-oncogene c-Fos n=1 Tax=Pararge aegeria TaxID=116150 RepID=UPI0019CFBFC2|nr:proto-oncogene c-Fos [Pararge aegeria]XP_039757161.1 proto-oncogene c-Fos [Pararge aegeria]